MSLEGDAKVILKTNGWMEPRAAALSFHCSLKGKDDDDDDDGG